MSWLWKTKALVYDPTIRRVSPVHRLVRFLAWRIGGACLNVGSRLSKFEIPHDPGVAPYFRLRWITGGYEREITHLYSKILGPEMAVVDVGAHAGYHTLRFAKLVGRRGKIFAFEPCPSMVAVLRRNVGRRGLMNVIIEEKAVRDVTARALLYGGQHAARHSTVPIGEPKWEVDSVSLDDYFRDKQEAVRLVKIDVEGAELKVLRGMRSLMGRLPHMEVILEFCPELLRLDGGEYAPMELLSLLYDSGFYLYEIRKDGELLALDSYGSCDRFVASVRKLTNLYASRQPWEKSESFT